MKIYLKLNQPTVNKISNYAICASEVHCTLYETIQFLMRFFAGFYELLPKKDEDKKMIRIKMSTFTIEWRRVSLTSYRELKVMRRNW